MIELRQHGKMWGEFDPIHLTIILKRGRITATFALTDLMDQAQPEPGDKLPEISKDEALQTLKRIAAASPFRRENGAGAEVDGTLYSVV